MSLAHSVTPCALISYQARLANSWCCRDCDASTGLHVKPKHSTCIGQLYMSMLGSLPEFRGVVLNDTSMQLVQSAVEVDSWR